MFAKRFTIFLALCCLTAAPAFASGGDDPDRADKDSTRSEMNKKADENAAVTRLNKNDFNRSRDEADKDAAIRDQAGKSDGLVNGTESSIVAKIKAAKEKTSGPANDSALKLNAFQRRTVTIAEKTLGRKLSSAEARDLLRQVHAARVRRGRKLTVNEARTLAKKIDDSRGLFTKAERAEFARAEAKPRDINPKRLEEHILALKRLKGVGRLKPSEHNATDFVAQTLGRPLSHVQALSFLKSWRGARSVLKHKLTAREARGVILAHNVGYGELGTDKRTPARKGNYTRAQLEQKVMFLKQAGIPLAVRREMVEKGIVGDQVTVDDTNSTFGHDAKGDATYETQFTVHGASKDEVVKAVDDVDPSDIAPVMNMSDTERNGDTVSAHGSVPFVPDSWGSEVTKTADADGADISATGPIVNGTARVDVSDADSNGDVVVTEKGDFGNTLTNVAHTALFDLADAVEGKINSENDNTTDQTATQPDSDSDSSGAAVDQTQNTDTTDTATATATDDSDGSQTEAQAPDPDSSSSSDSGAAVQTSDSSDSSDAAVDSQSADDSGQSASADNSGSSGDDVAAGDSGGSGGDTSGDTSGGGDSGGDSGGDGGDS